MEKKDYTTYEEVPWFRKWWVVLISFIVFPPATLYLLHTGKAYYRDKENFNGIKAWGKSSYYIALLFTIIWSVRFFSGVMGVGGSSDINIVKNGYLAYDRGVTVGNAFDNHKDLENIEWDSFKSDNGRRIVEFRAKLNSKALSEINKARAEISYPPFKEERLKIQFSINNDDTFQFYAGEINRIAKDKSFDATSEVDENVFKKLFNNLSII